MHETNADCRMSVKDASSAHVCLIHTPQGAANPLSACSVLGCGQCVWPVHKTSSLHTTSGN